MCSEQTAIEQSEAYHTGFEAANQSEWGLDDYQQRQTMAAIRGLMN